MAGCNGKIMDGWFGSLDFGAYSNVLSGLRLTSTCIRTKNSTIYKAVVPSSSRQYAVKQVDSGAQADLEYQSLSRLFQALPARASVAEPVCLIREHGLLVSEWVDGRSVKAWLQDRRNSVGRLSRILAASGEWLRELHAVQHPGRAPLELEKKLAQLDDLCRTHAGRPWRQWVLNWMRRRLVSSSRQYAGEHVPVADLHGDFKPENLLVETDRMVGIDIGHIYRSCVWNDVAYFLTQVEWTVFSSLNLRFAFAMRRLRRSFLEAYQPNGPDQPERLLHWLQQEVLFRFAHEHLARRRLDTRELAAMAIILSLFCWHDRRARRANTPGATR